MDIQETGYGSTIKSASRVSRNDESHSTRQRSETNNEMVHNQHLNNDWKRNVPALDMI